MSNNENEKNINRAENDEEYDIILPEGFCELHQIYDWQNYTIHRIKRVLKQWGYHLENIWAGYKGNRYPGYVEHYQIIHTETGQIINPDTTLYGLQKIFARMDIPLYDEYSQINKDAPKRNSGAEDFMELLNEARQKDTGNQND